MTAEEQTPLPWFSSVAGASIRAKMTATNVHGDNCDYTRIVCHGLRAADTALIVTAVNSHATLLARVAKLEKALREIGDYAHDKSTGPVVPDALWEVRTMAYAALAEQEPK